MAVIIGEKQYTVMKHLATEEYLLRHYDLKEDILFLWYGSKAYVFGRNQNPFIEIQPEQLNNHDIDKLRRVSGGGTIYEDEGTINFSIITKDYKNKINDYRYFLDPLINYLNRLGIEAYFKEKTHVFVGDKKISGNAQAFINHRLMHHGTLLFDTDLSMIETSLVNYSREAKGHQVLSNKQKVMNIKPYIKTDIDSFMRGLVEAYSLALDISQETIKNLDWDKIHQLIKDKYQSWSWNYGSTPRFQLDLTYKDEILSITVDKGIITDIQPNKYPFLIGEKFDMTYFNQKV
jgi:lipoate-protein ligase A